jgi:hypothetical protein
MRASKVLKFAILGGILYKASWIIKIGAVAFQVAAFITPKFLFYGGMLLLTL